MGNFNIVEQNHYRCTNKNNISILVIKNFGSIEVFNTQISYLRKKMWFGLEGKIFSFEGEKEITIQEFLSKLPRNRYSSSTNIDNTLLPVCQLVLKETEKLSSVKVKKSQEGAVYFDKTNRVWVCVFYVGDKKHKKCYSISKYGEEIARKKAEGYPELRKTCYGK